MAEQIERYLETAGAQVRWKRVCPALERELRTHLEEQTEAYVSEGMTEDAAEAEAVLAKDAGVSEKFHQNH